MGGEKLIRVDVRIVAATNRDLKNHIDAGSFREDLYYRLAVIVIELPPLRERGDDIRLLAEHFLTLCACEYGRPPPKLANDTLDCIYAYPWPGNVRELHSAIQRALLLAEDGTILPAHLPPEIGATSGISGPTSSVSSPATETGEFLTLDELERQHILRVLAATDGGLGRAAAILGIHRNTLRRRLREQGLA